MSPVINIKINFLIILILPINHYPMINYKRLNFLANKAGLLTKNFFDDLYIQ